MNTHDSDLGPVTLVDLPTADDIAAMPTQHRSLALAPAADAVRDLVPGAAAYFDRAHLAIWQPHGPDVVALPGARLVIAAGTVTRTWGTE